MTTEQLIIAVGGPVLTFISGWLALKVNSNTQRRKQELEADTARGGQQSEFLARELATMEQAAARYREEMDGLLSRMRTERENLIGDLNKANQENRTLVRIYYSLHAHIKDTHNALRSLLVKRGAPPAEVAALFAQFTDIAALAPEKVFPAPVMPRNTPRIPAQVPVADLPSKDNPQPDP